MRQLKTIQFLLLCALLALLVSGCATQNVNPPQARANTGYVDFHAESASELCWQVECFDDRAQSFKNVFAELDPPAGGFLRLAFAPGHHRLRVTVLNRVVREPGLVEVGIKDGLIMPVNIRLIPDGTTQVQIKEQRVGGTAKGRYGWKTKYSSTETTVFKLSAEAETPVSYHIKEQTSYVR
jgi:hypothetical protein